MNRKFSLPNLRDLKVPLAALLLISGVFLFCPLASCSSDTEKPTIVRSTAVPDDGYKAPQKAKKQDPTKQKPKIVSFRMQDRINL
jgi:hypothetical protein